MNCFTSLSYSTTYTGLSESIVVELFHFSLVLMSSFSSLSSFYFLKKRSSRSSWIVPRAALVVQLSMASMFDMTFGIKLQFRLSTLSVTFGINFRFRLSMASVIWGVTETIHTWRGGNSSVTAFQTPILSTTCRALLESIVVELFYFSLLSLLKLNSCLEIA